MKLFHLSRNVSGQRNHHAKLRGFTLIELLVVIAVIAVLVSMLLPALQGARTQAKMTVCSVQLKQLGLIWISYADDYNDFYPPTTSWSSIWAFLHDELDRRDVADGDIFYCSDFEPSFNTTTNTVMDWYNQDQYGRYAVGYNLYTTVVWCGNPGSDGTPDDPLNAPWRAADGVGDYSKYLSWQYSYQYADAELRYIIPAWKNTERSHVVNCWTPVKKTLMPDMIPLAYDMANSSGQALQYQDITSDIYTFTKNSTRHLNTGKGVPLGTNAVYMDGHAERRNTEDLRILMDFGSQWSSQAWF